MQMEEELAKPEWGLKRICLGCGARFYDMKRDPINCPKCDAKFDPTAVTRSCRSRVAAVVAVDAAKKAEAAEAAAKAKASTDDDLDLEVEDDDDGDDPLIDDDTDLDEDEDVSEVIVGVAPEKSDDA